MNEEGAGKEALAQDGQAALLGPADSVARKTYPR